ncbi:MAG: hypothetical protein WCD79_18175 [Chthoniobacteraceae bacterium]
MPIKTSFLLFMLCCSAFAEQPWPKHVAEANFVETSSSTLPKALRESLLGFDEFSQGAEKLPGTLEVSRVTLKQDATAEFIVKGNQSYSGGPMMYVFERRKETYICIATLAGCVYFGPRVNGYFQIVSQGRGGAGISARELYRYQHGTYHLVRLTDYRLRESGGGFDFIRERNPKENDH